MNSIRTSTIRRFAYAALLAFTTLNFAPSLASGQEVARGKFTLSHDVRWGNVTVPAGEYQFSMESDAVARVVTLNQLDHNHKSFLLLVHDMEDAKPTDHSRLVLRTAMDGSSYVSAMQLPEFGVTLMFATPARTEKQIARAGTAAAALGQ
jgi:hypothetical protein